MGCLEKLLADTGIEHCRLWREVELLESPAQVELAAERLLGARR